METLETDQRVLSRISDGIYRQPASALRELIANAYDADASQVVIETDAPRFDRVIVRDDGRGMSAETLAHVLKNIGGSLKRTAKGSAMDVTSDENTSLSPGGRKLIGKIGIGLFSVSQLTAHFQIITKIRGEDERRVADVILASEEIEKAIAERGDDTRLRTGDVELWSVPAADKEAQGTEIVLMDIRPQTKELLRSQARWTALDSRGTDGTSSLLLPNRAVKPAFHIGQLDFSEPDQVKTPASLPWDREDPPNQRFPKLVEGVRSQVAKNKANPELSQVLDEYFRMVWDLAMALPGRYVDKHPFDLCPDDGLLFYELSNEAGDQATALELGEDETPRSQLKLRAPEGLEDTGFEVLVDEMRLRRPMRFKRAASKSSVAVRQDLLFVGRAQPDLKEIPESYRGGELEFEAYLYWSPKIVPKEHQGVLVRLKGASGTLFDATFMDYQVAEQNRLNQLTAEIFVSEGLEGALNIDRESFNYASIHYQYISRWLHNAIRQYTNTQKDLASKLRKGRRDEEQRQQEEAVSEKARDIWAEVRGADGDEPPEVVITDDPSELEERRSSGEVALQRDAVLPDVSGKGAARARKESAAMEPRVKALTVVLEAYGILEDMPYDRQQRLIRGIIQVFAAEAGTGTHGG